MSAQDADHIIEEFVAMVAERGYVQSKISHLSARTGVARTHFYELFKDKEDCFLAAQRELAATIVDDVRRAVAGADPAGATRAALAAVTDFADRSSAAFTFATHETTLAGPGAWAERERMIAAIGGEIERGWEGVPAKARRHDLAGGYLLGGAMRTLGMRMRRGEKRPKDLLGELVAWIETYEVPEGTRGWSGVIASAHPLPERRDLAVGPIEPARLPRGRHRLPAALAKRSQRERLLHATGRVAAEKGYEKASVADIVAAAGVSREVFYEHFHDKQEAFAETIKFVFEALMAGTAGAFFASEGPWPERIWQAGLAFIGFIVERVDLAQPVFTESYATATGIKRSDDFLLGFTLFLQDGYRYRPQAARVPKIAGEAIGGAVLEAINTYLRGGRAAELAELVPGCAYIVLAPFMGAQGAYEFVVGKAGGGEGPLLS